MRSIFWAGGLAALLGGALQADAQELPVQSNYGARCTVATGGRQFDEFVMPSPPSNPSRYAIHFAHNWPRDTGDTVTVTCSEAGFETRTLTFSRVPMYWFSSSAPCGTSDNLPIEPQETYCLNHHEAHKADYPEPVMEFPRLTVPLDPKPGN